MRVRVWHMAIMTLSMAWIRTVGTAHELVFASDSRLSGGQAWDGCPKILTLARGDSLIAFAGDTLAAYPLMLQFRNWVESDPRARTRERDISELKKRMRLMFMDMRAHISALPRGVTTPDPYDCELIFGGWSWRSNAFRLWRFHWVEVEAAYNFSPVGSHFSVGHDHPIIFAGNPDAAALAKERITALLKARGRFRTPYFDMEPFEVLRDIIREQAFHDIGGPPQLAKVYRHGNSQPFAVRWDTPTSKSDLTMLGRPLFPGERTWAPVIDPDKIEFRSPRTLAKRKRPDQSEAAVDDAKASS